jgi:hypothetical protein
LFNSLISPFINSPFYSSLTDFDTSQSTNFRREIRQVVTSDGIKVKETREHTIQSDGLYKEVYDRAIGHRVYREVMLREHLNTNPISTVRKIRGMTLDNIEIFLNEYNTLMNNNNHTSEDGWQTLQS